MPQEPKPTAAAIRAALKIQSESVQKTVFKTEDIAQIIDREFAELVGAASSARSAIILGNGRKIDWNEIADKLTSALAKLNAK